jgi:hypothetical protein
MASSRDHVLLAALSQVGLHDYVAPANVNDNYSDGAASREGSGQLW